MFEREHLAIVTWLLKKLQSEGLLDNKECIAIALAYHSAIEQRSESVA